MWKAVYVGQRLTLEIGGTDCHSMQVFRDKYSDRVHSAGYTRLLPCVAGNECWNAGCLIGSDAGRQVTHTRCFEALCTSIRPDKQGTLCVHPGSDHRSPSKRKPRATHSEQANATTRLAGLYTYHLYLAWQLCQHMRIDSLQFLLPALRVPLLLTGHRL